MPMTKFNRYSAVRSAFCLGLASVLSASGAAVASSVAGLQPDEVARTQNARLGLIPVPWPRKSIAPAERSVTTPRQATKRSRVEHHAPARMIKIKAAPVPPAEPVKAATPAERPAKDAPVVTLVPHPTAAPPVAPPMAAKAIATVPAGPPTAADKARTRAAELLIDGQILAARRVLADKAVAQDPAVIATLGQTYDPLVLDAFPNLKASADADRARELYLLAISKGNVEAKQRLMALEAARKK